MAVTQNTYTGDGSTVLFSFTFPYLEATDIKVSLNGTNTTAYTLANATTVQFNTAPANGAAIRIYRQTDDSALAATFYPGSAIRSNDLNENFTQNLYVTQESTNNVATATSTANTALTNSNTAISTANTALSTANTASTNASAAVSTANTASTNASAAVSTANTASTNATAAVNTANSAANNAATAISTANTALSTANTASSNASAAISTANTASTNASAAVSTANTASTNASSAVSTANTASSNASTALSTANTAISTANAAASAVANAILYDIVANVAAIPASPANNDAVEVTNSTGIESFTPLTGVPGGFVGNSGLSVRLVYTTTGSTWNWIQYFPNDPETRYLKLGSTGTVTSTMLADGTIVNADINASAAIAGTKISPDFGSQNVTTTGTVTGASLNPTSSTVPANGVYLPAANTVGISTNSSERIRIGANGEVGIGGANYGTSGQVLTSGGSGAAPSWQTLSVSANSITQGNTSATVIDTGSDGRFVVTTEGSERARVDSSGRLLVGTSTTRSWSGVDSQIQIESTSLTSQSIFNNSASTTGALFAFGKSRGTSTGSNTVVQSGDTLGNIVFLGADGSALKEGASVKVEVDGTPGSNDMPGRLVFSTTADGASSPTERMRIDNAGNLMYGITSFTNAAKGFLLNGSSGRAFITCTGDTVLDLNRLTNTGDVVAFRASTTQVGSITVTGSATAYNTSSDYRLKENVAPVTDGITRLQQLKPSRFNFIADPDTVVDGFIAHEVQEVVPEAITGEKDAVDDENNPIYQGIDQSKLVPLLTAALQEAIGEIESLKARVAALESA